MTTPIPIVNVTASFPDYWQAAITAAFTVFSGIILYLLKVILDEAWLSHVREYRKLKAERSYHMVKYANVYMNVAVEKNALSDEAMEKLRDEASKLVAFIEIRPRFCWLVPKREVLKKAVSELIGLSNGVYSPKEYMGKQIDFNDKRVKELCMLLNLSAGSL